MLLLQDEKNQVLVSNVWIRQVSDWFHFRGVVGDFEKIYVMMILCKFCGTGRLGAFNVSYGCVQYICGRRSGLMIGALDYEASGLGSSPGPGHCVVFLAGAIIGDGDRKSRDSRAPMIWDNFSIFRTKCAILTSYIDADSRTCRGLSRGCCHVAWSSGESWEILLRIFHSDDRE